MCHRCTLSRVRSGHRTLSWWIHLTRKHGKVRARTTCLSYSRTDSSTLAILFSEKERFSNVSLFIFCYRLIKWQFQTVSKSFCKIDIMNFPFDEQHCSISIRSSGRDRTMMGIIKRNHKVKVMENFKTEWFIINSLVEESTLLIGKNRSNTIPEFSVLRFNMRLRRVTTYYFLKIIFPFSIITSVTLFTFWLAPDSSSNIHFCP